MCVLERIYTQQNKENTHGGNHHEKNFTEIEEIIETRIAQLSEEYDLDRYDIEDIRLEAYQENGWSCDPFPLEDGDEEEDGWMEEGCHYRSMEE